MKSQNIHPWVLLSLLATSLETPLFGDVFDEKGSLTSYKHPWYLQFRGGYQFMQESPGMMSSRTQIVDNHILFKGETGYVSANSITANKQNLSSPVIAFEVSTGIPFDKIPLFRDIQTLAKSRNFFFGIGASFYPKIGRESQYYNGNLTYENALTADPALRTMNFPVSMTLEENFFSLVPEATLYYMFPSLGKDSGRSAFFARVYLGITGGMGLLSGKRKIGLTSQDVTINAQVYNINTAFQDTVIDGLGFKGALTLGTLMHLKDGHFIDIRAAYILHETNATFTRTGFWNETQKDANGNLGYTISRRNLSEETKYAFNQGGILITLGYTARIK
jgi:hypothetical protein